MKHVYKTVLAALVLLSSSSAVSAGDLTVRTDRSKLPLNGTIEGLTPLNAEATYLSAPAQKTPAEKPGYSYVGTGRWKDDIFSIALFDAANAGLEWDVEIYESDDTKGKYLIANPYGDCPIEMIPQGEYSDIIVHTEKPELVYMEYTDLNMIIKYVGKDKNVSVGSSMGRWISMGLDEEDVVDFADPGKFEDGVLTFEKDDMLIELSGTRYTTNRNGLFQLLFPQAKDMSVELTAPTCVDEDTFDFSVKAGKDVTSVKYMLVSGIYKLSDESGATVAKNGRDLESTSGNWSLKLDKSEINSFDYTFFVVGCDEEGNYVSGRVAWMVHSVNNESDWADFGEAEYTDDIISSIYTFSYAQDKNATYKVKVQQSVTTPGLLRICQPYGKGTYYDFFNKHDMEHPHFLIIDATDADKVEVEPSAVGFEGGGSGFFVMSTAAVLLENGATAEDVAGYYGKYDKESGVITIPANGIAYGDTKEPTGLYMANVSAAFRLKFDSTSGVTEITADADREAEYYDLNGRNIADPTAAGIYVERRGDKVSKVVIR